MRQQFYDILRLAFNSFMDGVHTCIPGSIQSFDPLTKKASVKPLVQKKFENETLSYPVITNVPVVFPGTKDVVLSFPLSAGDGCLILFSEVSLERYLSSAGEEVEPGETRKFALSDAVCLPGLFPFGSPGAVGDGLALQVKYKTTEIRIDDTGITLKSGDASGWAPNILGNDPSTGVPHGGVIAGIIKLKGG